MEIIKIAVNEAIMRINLGATLSADKQSVTGTVELDIESQNYFMDMLNSIFEEGKNHILVDLTNITYIDSSGLWALFEGHKKAQQRNGNLILLNPTKDVKRVLDITKMSSKLKIFTDEKEALDALK